jgi:hypothetical protein
MMRGNPGESAQSEPFAAMPFERHLLNPDLRLERRALLRSLTQLHGSAAAASYDFGSLRGRVDKALALLDSGESDELPDNKLADRWAIIRDMIEDLRTMIEDFLRVMG